MAIINGDEKDNTLTGTAGDDTLDGKTGRDKMAGGLGDDTYVVDNVGDLCAEGAGEGTDLVQTSITYKLPKNIENLTLTGVDHINATGNELPNVLIGNAGDNILDGGAEVDFFSGGRGNDTYLLDAAQEMENIVEMPGEGIDTLKIGFAGTRVVVVKDKNKQPKPLKISLSEYLSEIENVTITGSGLFDLIGNAADNILSGNGVKNLIDGGAGNDRLDGGAGVDTLIGGLGSDTYLADIVKKGSGAVIEDVIREIEYPGVDTVLLRGSLSLSKNSTIIIPANCEGLDATATISTKLNLTGNALNNVLAGNLASNVLSSGDGDDTLIGGGGRDTMKGGLGNDVFVVDNALGTAILIADYATGDKIGLAAKVFGDLFANGALKAGVLGRQEVAATPEMKLLYNADTGLLAYDADGNGSAAVPLELVFVGSKTHPESIALFLF